LRNNSLFLAWSLCRPSQVAVTFSKGTQWEY